MSAWRGIEEEAATCDRAELEELITRAVAHGASTRDAEVAELRAVLRRLHDWRGLCDEDHIETFDRIAHDFLLATGYMRPGKSELLALEAPFEDRVRAWNEWISAQNAEIDDAIRAALGEGPRREP